MSGALVALVFGLVPRCGDGNVDPGEDCETCPEDVACLPCETCMGGECVTVNCLPCGNGIIDPGETCVTCPSDVPCAPGEICDQDTELCVALCGNGLVDPGENCETCPQDVMCPFGEVCIGGVCTALPDCSGNGILPMDIVFLMDTSGSMDDEALALCASISQVESELEALGLVVTTTLWGITGVIDGWCLTDFVENALGVSMGNSEDWGPATTATASLFPWTPGSTRVIVPISDEGPATGDPCHNPGDDRDAVLTAIIAANAHDVIVSPIAGTFECGKCPDSECVVSLMQELAAGTGGIFFDSKDPKLDLAGAIFDLAKAAIIDCPGDLDGDGIVGILDFLALLAVWGPCSDPCPTFCLGDIDNDCNVGITDFLLLLSNWD